MFPANGSLFAAPPFPPSGPGEPSSPLSAVLRRRYDFPSAYPRSLIGSLPLPTRSSSVRVRLGAPGRSEVSFQARALLCAGHPNLRLARAWTRMGSLRSSGDPSCAFAPFQDPGRTDVPSPLAVTSMLPPLSGQRRLRRWLISGLTRELRHLLSYASRFRCRHVQSSLPAGRLGLYRAGVEPAGSLREVSARVDDHPPLLLS